MSDQNRTPGVPVVAHPVFLRTCLANWEAYELAAAEMDASEELDPSHKERMGQSGVAVIVFAAFALESLINFYGRDRLGKSLFEQVDGLRLVAKWEIIPRLATGKSIDKSQDAFERFTKLIDARNRLAHYKIAMFKTGDDLQELMDKKALTKRNMVRMCAPTVFDMVDLLRQIDPDWWPIRKYSPDVFAKGRYAKLIAEAGVR